MTTISNYSITHPSNLTDYAQDSTGSNLNSNIDTKAYLGPGYNILPGVTNIFSAPDTFYKSIKAGFQSYRIGDYEGIFENALRSGLSSTTFLHSATQAVSYIFELLIILNKASDSIRKVVNVINTVLSSVGLGLCSCELVLESFAHLRQKRFQKSFHAEQVHTLHSLNRIENLHQRRQKVTAFLNTFLPTIKTGSIFETNCALENRIADEIKGLLENGYRSDEGFCDEFKKLSPEIAKMVYCNQLESLQSTHFSLSLKRADKIDVYVQKRLSHLPSPLQTERKNKIIQENFTRKKVELARRLEHWLTEEISQQLPQLVKDLKSWDSATSSQALQNAQSLFIKCEDQSEKKDTIHRFGMIGIGFTIIGLTVSLLGGPIGVVTFFLLMGGTIACTRWAMHEGWIHHEGWTFDYAHCVPALVKNIWNRVFNGKADTSASQKAI
ncbi:MAG: hypothetical protein V4492_04615 [Chlamydiota bacterium]